MLSGERGLFSRMADVLVLAPGGDGECRLEVEPYAEAVARVRGQCAGEGKSSRLPEAAGLEVLACAAGAGVGLPCNPLATCVALALGAPEGAQWRGAAVFYRRGRWGRPCSPSVRDTVLVTSLTLRAVHELTGRNM